MKWLKAILEYIKADVAEDKATLKRIFDEKKILPDGRKEQIKQVLTKEWKSFIGYCLFVGVGLALAFMMGWLMGAAYYETSCNTYIYETYIEPQEMGLWGICAGSNRTVGLDNRWQFNMSKITTIPVPID